MTKSSGMQSNHNDKDQKCRKMIVWWWNHTTEWIRRARAEGCQLFAPGSDGLFKNPGKTRGFFLTVGQIPKFFAPSARLWLYKDYAIFINYQQLLHQISAPQAKILRFLHSEMMISIAKSIENSVQIPNFPPPAGSSDRQLETPPLVRNPGKTRGGVFQGGGGYSNYL